MLINVIIVAVIGILVGGVVNLLADDLPQRRALRFRRATPTARRARRLRG
ncbi:MAG: hypothetical protein U0703_03340 [Anaerolineae bacterium]